MLEVLAYDPLLANTKLIAEAWDAGGLYQVGSFPAYGRWAEWNGRYRDDLRRFVKGDAGMIGAMAARIQGSPDIYGERGPCASINFVTAHDGFTLRDLVSFNQKRNLTNGEDNRDGMDENLSWNCGCEGPSADAEVKSLRERQMKNFLSILLLSQGVPMLLMGDEIGQSKGGNNNSYCHDDEINYFDWGALRANAALLRFTQHLILFRQAHPVLRRRSYLKHQPADALNGSQFCESISFHGREPWQPDWSDESRQLAVMLCGSSAGDDDAAPDILYLILNAHWETASFALPRLPQRLTWHVAVNTGMSPPQDSHPPGQEIQLEDQDTMIVGARSVILLTAG